VVTPPLTKALVGMKGPYGSCLAQIGISWLYFVYCVVAWVHELLCAGCSSEMLPTCFQFFRNPSPRGAKVYLKED